MPEGGGEFSLFTRTCTTTMPGSLSVVVGNVNRMPAMPGRYLGVVQHAQVMPMQPLPFSVKYHHTVVNGYIDEPDFFPSGNIFRQVVEVVACGVKVCSVCV